MLSSSQKGKSDSKYYWETSKEQTKESCHATVLIHGSPQTPGVVFLFIVWTPAFMLNIKSFTDKLLAFTKLSKGKSFPCTTDVFCF